MGQSKGGGYDKMPTLLPEQMSLLQQILGQAQGNSQQAAQGYQQFLPGGGGGEAIRNQANQQFQQQTIPSILNAFGPGSKGSSSLNQALASGGANLNTNLASLLSQMQLQASQGLGSLAQGQQQLGLGTPGFAYQQQQRPAWQQWVGPAIQATGTIGGAALGSLGGPVGTAAGGAAGNAAGNAASDWVNRTFGNDGQFDWRGT